MKQYLRVMSQQMQFIGFTYEQAQHFIQTIVKACLEENTRSIKNNSEAPVTTKQACEILGVSAPTLRKFVAMSLIRRHDLGPRKKVFYRSELEEDIKRIRAARSFKNEE